jgi:serine/threonine-protein kinase
MLSNRHSLACRVYDSETRKSRAGQAAQRALEIDPNLPEAHAALGRYYDFCQSDYERALEHYIRAEELSPNNPLILVGMALARDRLGLWDEGVVLAERAVDIDPLNERVLRLSALLLSLGRRHEDAEQRIDQAIAAAPDMSEPYLQKWTIHWNWHGPSPESRRVLETLPTHIADVDGVWAQQELGERRYEAALERLSHCPGPGCPGPDQPLLFYLMPPEASLHPLLSECFCYREMNEPGRAREKCDQARLDLDGKLAGTPDVPIIQSWLGLAYAFLGRTEEAVSHGERAVSMFPSIYAAGGDTCYTHLAITYATVGEHEAAIDTIETLLSVPKGLTKATLRLHPFWDPLRDHPRFAEILEKYGEEQ